MYLSVEATRYSNWSIPYIWSGRYLYSMYEFTCIVNVEYCFATFNGATSVSILSVERISLYSTYVSLLHTFYSTPLHLCLSTPHMSLHSTHPTPTVSILQIHQNVSIHLTSHFCNLQALCIVPKTHCEHSETPWSTGCFCYWFPSAGSAVSFNKKIINSMNK